MTSPASPAETSPLERRYRRLLRLLPVRYRAQWEEDMVLTFLQRADGRLTASERLSVVGLATRLRLTGAYRSPRGLVWGQFTFGLALMCLLYKAVAGSAGAVFNMVYVIEYGSGTSVGGTVIGGRRLLFWGFCVSLLWVAAFSCFVVGRVTAARILTVLAGASAIGHIVAFVAITGWPVDPFSPTTAAYLGWLAVSVVAVLIAPSQLSAPPRPWLGAYVVGALLVSLVELRLFVPAIAQYSQRLHVGKIEDVALIGVAAAMLVALALSRTARRPSPGWLLALAAAGVSIATRSVLPTLASVPISDQNLELAVAALAVVCVAVGVIRWLRLPAPRTT